MARSAVDRGRSDVERFAALLKAARAGSGPALGELLQAFRPLLLDQAADAIPDRLKGKSSPSDVAQNSLAEVVRDFGHFRGHTEAEWKAWLLAILRHNALGMIDHYLRGKRAVRKETPAASP
jgi:DNA-directed RNA polymerase specialized sigma24 family protein